VVVEQYDAFPLVGIGAREHRYAGVAVARVGRQVRHAGGNEQKLPRSHIQLLAQLRAVTHCGAPLEDMDRGLVVLVQVRAVCAEMPSK
jgi:hypothetical protein